MSKVLHYNSEAEQSVLGAMLLDDSAFDEAQPLKASHFSSRVHSMIYLAISDVVSKGKTPEPQLVAAVLDKELEDCGGMKYLIALRDSIPSSRNTDRFAKIIRDKATERGLLAASEDIKSIVAQKITPEEKLNQASQLINQLAISNVKKQPKTIYELALERTQYYEALKRGEVQPGIKTQIPKLDLYLAGGLREQDLIILAARPSTGKSSLAQQIARTISAQGFVTLFLSMEMSEKQITDRGIANIGHINYGKLKTGDLEKAEWSQVVEALEEMKNYQFRIDDQAALTITDIRAKARSIPGLKFLVLDYLQLCQGNADNRNYQIEEISRGLKQIAKDLNITVLALSQLNRQVEQRSNKKPNMSDLRDSGAIEQDADVIMFLWPVHDFNDGRKLIGLNIAKNREGQTGDIALDFQGAYQRWGQSMDNLDNYQSYTAKSGGLS